MTRFLLLITAAAAALAQAEAPAVRAAGQDLKLSYRSPVDGTDQPYRLYVPSSYTGARDSRWSYSCTEPAEMNRPYSTMPVTATASSRTWPRSIELFS